MKKNNLLWAFLLLGGIAQAQDWPEVRPEARPGSRWWWLGSAVDEKNLSYNLAEYGSAGLGSLEITPIYGVQGNDKNDIDFLSPKWMEMLRYTQAEGKKNGIDIDMNTGTGWPFGGPEVTIEEAASKALFETWQADGGKKVTLDIRISDPKEAKRQKGIARLNRLMAYDGKGTCLDLTSKVSDGKLVWDAPEGEWELVALFIGKTLQKVKRAAPGGEGYVMDHLNPQAVKDYFSKFDRAFEGSQASYPRSFFNDSYEVYGADWTPSLLEEFEKRRGYKLEEHFPEFLDTIRPETTRRIVSDYRETMGEMLIDNFTVPWTQWAHSHGSTTRNQAHGSPANLIDTYASVDIPEIEGFGLTDFHIKGLRKDSLTRPNFSDISMLKYASSAAHISGKPYVSSETFTWLTDHFRTSLSQCKPDMDLMFVSGVNHMFFHGTPYSPQEAAWPGWRFYASINMSPTNTIWRDAPAFFQYITRCQSFLQMGQPDNDFLVYLPIYDIWDELPGRMVMFDIHKMDQYAPKFIKTIQTIIAGGFDVDYISDAFIKTTRCENTELVTSGGTHYKALVVPAARLMPAATLKKLVSLARQGATVVFVDQYPEDVPGYSQLEKNRKAFASVLAELPEAASFKETQDYPIGKGRIIIGSDYHQVLEATGTPAEEMKTRYGLQFIRRANPTGHHYFISCLQSKDVDAWIPLNVGEPSAMLFNPMNGEKGLAQTRMKDGRLEIRLQLKSGESIIVQTFEKKPEGQTAWKYIEEQPLSLSLDHGWKLTFIESTPAIEGEFDIDTPTSWTELDHPDAKTNMGTGRYTLTIDRPALKADDWILDLGDVRESARVRINGNDAGTAWAVPFRLSIGKWLKPGKNTIEIEVTNLPCNRISEMDRQGVKWRIFKEINMVKLNYKKGEYSHLDPMPSGLNGNVRLIPVNYASETAPATNGTDQDYCFQFNPSGKASDGCISITSESVYPGADGFGYDLLPAPESKSNQPFFFSVNVPDGNYRVTVTLGSKKQAGVTTVRGESRRLFLENIATRKGEFKTYSFTINKRNTLISGKEKVQIKKREQGKLNWDDKLTFEFNGSAPCLARLEIERIENVPTVFLAGNSTVVDQDNEPWASWGQMIPRFFDERICFANYAESGERADTFIKAGRLKKALSQMKPGDYMFIEFGHNDQKLKGAGKGAYYFFATQLKTFVDEVRSKGGIPIFVTPTQRRSFDENGKIKETHEDYPDAMRWVAGRENVPVLELHDMTRTFYETLGVENSKKAFVHYPAGTYPGQDRELADNTHFNPYGAYEIAKCVIEGMKQLDLPLTQYLRPDYQSFDPARPDNPDEFKWDNSPFTEIEKPDGN